MANVRFIVSLVLGCAVQAGMAFYFKPNGFGILLLIISAGLWLKVGLSMYECEIRGAQTRKENDNGRWL